MASPEVPACLVPSAFCPLSPQCNLSTVPAPQSSIRSASVCRWPQVDGIGPFGRCRERTMAKDAKSTKTPAKANMKRIDMVPVTHAAGSATSVRLLPKRKCTKGLNMKRPIDCQLVKAAATELYVFGAPTFLEGTPLCNEAAPLHSTSSRDRLTSISAQCSPSVANVWKPPTNSNAKAWEAACAEEK